MHGLMGDMIFARGAEPLIGNFNRLILFLAKRSTKRSPQSPQNPLIVAPLFAYQ